MRFLVISRQKPGLNDTQKQGLYQAVTAFHTNPGAVKVEADYALADRSGSYSVVDVPDRATLDAKMAAFAPFVTTEVLEVMPAAQG
ncbi:MAG: hypothetical protein KC613_14890 [Myxococcales bacterium]|nr:hypothetical protein [Myxococcales bacterium]MCB9525788.1 hypothetical protein [Myxococcales bacterium]